MGVRVSPAEARELERIVREQRGEARLYRRARMVLLAASGASITAVAGQMGTNRTRVGEWLGRFEAKGVEGLEDEPPSGRSAPLVQWPRTAERKRLLVRLPRQPGPVPPIPVRVGG